MDDSDMSERGRQAATQARWARVLLESLADAGVHDVVISPGSRSTPFVLAALRARRREGRSELRCHDVADERSAAFFALGRARVTGRPSLLVCTSGSAAGHYLPAVLEAEADHLPLLILSADRPVELQDCGANQTLDQNHLFGRYVRRFFDLGLADAGPDALRGLRRLAAQAVFDSRYPTPGAVHLNARARKPLEPPPPSADSRSSDTNQILARPIAEPTAPRRMPQAREIDLFLDRAESAESGLIVCGPAHLDQGEVRDRLRLLANRLRWPVVADATSQLRDADTVHGAEALLKTPFADRQAPAMVLQIGRAPAASAWLRAIKAWCTVGGCRDHWVVADHGWNDPESTASHLLWSDADAFVDGLLERIDHVELPRPSAVDAHAAWRRASELARQVAYELIHDLPESESGGLAEPVLIRQTVAALPPDAQLMLGNSLPVREVDLWVEGEEFDGRAVLHQRGLSGIDGNVAGAVGAALGGRPTLLLLGDVSLRHDLGSLELARRAPSLVFAVVDNGGGRIFEHLPLADHPVASDEVFGHWLQPGTVDLEAVARAQGLSYARPKTPRAVAAAVRDAFAAGGAWLLDLKARPDSAMRWSRRLTKRLQRALEEQGLC